MTSRSKIRSMYGNCLAAEPVKPITIRLPDYDTFLIGEALAMAVKIADRNGSKGLAIHYNRIRETLATRVREVRK